jgi:hypothetical protein
MLSIDVARGRPRISPEWVICRRSQAEVFVDLPQRPLGGYVIPDLTRHMRLRADIGAG